MIKLGNYQDRIKETAKKLIRAGIEETEAKNTASVLINSQGMTKIEKGECPKGLKSPLACIFCYAGHLSECHYPLDCKSANCNHYKWGLTD